LAHEKWMRWSSRIPAGARQERARYWAVDVASVPALSRFCTATLLQLIQIDVQPTEKVIVRLAGKALDDLALQSHLLLLDAQLAFVDATIRQGQPREL
jgi:hypothetical protein